MSEETIHLMPAAVATVFSDFEEPACWRLMVLRDLIFLVAASNSRIGPLTETLKWGEPAYLTKATKSGSTIRLGCPKNHPHSTAVYFNCKTTLISSFRDVFRDTFIYEGNRAIILRHDETLDKKALGFCFEAALTYHLDKSCA